MWRNGAAAQALRGRMTHAFGAIAGPCEAAANTFVCVAVDGTALSKPRRSDLPEPHTPHGVIAAFFDDQAGVRFGGGA